MSAFSQISLLRVARATRQSCARRRRKKFFAEIVISLSPFKPVSNIVTNNK